MSRDPFWVLRCESDQVKFSLRGAVSTGVIVLSCVIFYKVSGYVFQLLS